jgi:hypothetical protein
MSLHDDLSDSLDGIPIGRGSLQVVCDLPHDVPEAVEFEGPVQYECIRVTEAMLVFRRAGYECFDVWIPDLLRCSACERESLPEPTDGYEEVLIEIGVGWDDDQRVLDSTELRVLDHSPVDDGQPMPSFPLSLLQTSIERADPGMLRRSRVARSAAGHRANGDTEYADLLEAQLDI